jgi:hypothetical protein
MENNNRTKWTVTLVVLFPIILVIEFLTIKNLSSMISAPCSNEVWLGIVGVCAFLLLNIQLYKLFQRKISKR